MGQEIEVTGSISNNAHIVLAIQSRRLNTIVLAAGANPLWLNRQCFQQLHLLPRVLHKFLSI